LSTQEFTLTFSLRAIVLAVLATVVLVSPAFAQGFSVESKSPPSVVGAGPFVSLQGRFSIALPKGMHGFRPLAVDTPAGRLTGDAYNWTMKEGRYTVGFVQGPQSMEGAEDVAALFGNVRRGMTAWATSKNGKITSDVQIELDKHPGLEMKLEFPDALFWQRVYIVSGRLFQVVLIVNTDQRTYQAEALKVLDTFKILSEAEVAAAVRPKRPLLNRVHCRRNRLLLAMDRMQLMMVYGARLRQFWRKKKISRVRGPCRVKSRKIRSTTTSVEISPGQSGTTTKEI